MLVLFVDLLIWLLTAQYDDKEDIVQEKDKIVWHKPEGGELFSGLVGVKIFVLLGSLVIYLGDHVIFGLFPGLFPVRFLVLVVGYSSVWASV